MNITQLLRGSAQEFRDLPALARGTSPHLTYRELWRKVSVMSTHLTGRFGLARGDIGPAFRDVLKGMDI